MTDFGCPSKLCARGVSLTSPGPSPGSQVGLGLSIWISENKKRKHFRFLGFSVFVSLIFEGTPEGNFLHLGGQKAETFPVFRLLSFRVLNF